MNEINNEPMAVEFNFNESTLVKEIANIIEAGDHVDLPLFIRDLKSAIAKEVDKRRVNQSRAAARLKLNRGSYRKYLFRTDKPTDE